MANVTDIKQPCKHGTRPFNYCWQCGEEYIKTMMEIQGKPKKPLTDMTAEELLASYSESAICHYLYTQAAPRDVAARRMLPDEANRLSMLRTELLRRLAAPVISPEPKCPKCGSGRVTLEYFADNSWGVCGDRKCSFKADTSQFFTSKAEGDSQGPHYGKDCPKGKVQVEFVGCRPEDRYSNYGWKPTDHAFIEIWIDGERFRLEIGDFHDGMAHRRGLHVIGPIDMSIEKTSVNAASIWRELPAPPKEG